MVTEHFQEDIPMGIMEGTRGPCVSLLGAAICHHLILTERALIFWVTDRQLKRLGLLLGAWRTCQDGAVSRTSWDCVQEREVSSRTAVRPRPGDLCLSTWEEMELGWKDSPATQPPGKVSRGASILPGRTATAQDHVAVSAHKTAAGCQRTQHSWPCSSGTVHRKRQGDRVKL